MVSCHMMSRVPWGSHRYLTVLFLLLLQGSWSLRDMEVILPPAVSLGETVNLTCQYHLQGEHLYTAKLYKGRHEFLQLVPAKGPKPLKTFPLKGVTIESITLNGTGKTVTGLHVTLRDVNLFSTGLYGCEASAEESFHTQIVRKYMTVIVKPDARPSLSGLRPHYRVGDVTNATCVVKDTFPTANISWFINGDKIANPKFIQSHSERSPSGLLSTISVLNLPLKAHHFRVGRLHAKCVASMLTMHWQSLDVESLEESPTLLAASSHMEDRPPATNLSTIGSTKTKSNEEVKGNDKDSPFASLSLNHAGSSTLVASKSHLGRIIALVSIRIVVQL